MVANHLSNQCLAHMRTGYRLKSTVVVYFPLDRYEGRCSIDIFYQEEHGGANSCYMILLVVAIVVIRCSYRQLIQVSPV